MSTQDHHYFASFAFGWKTAPTADEAIKGLVKGFRPEFKRMVAAAHKKGEAGAYIWTCRVELPADAKYSISFYAPKDVPKSEGTNRYVTYVTSKDIAYYTEGAE